MEVIKPKSQQWDLWEHSIHGKIMVWISHDKIATMLEVIRCGSYILEPIPKHKLIRVFTDVWFWVKGYCRIYILHRKKCHPKYFYAECVTLSTFIYSLYIFFQIDMIRDPVVRKGRDSITGVKVFASWRLIPQFSYEIAMFQALYLFSFGVFLQTHIENQRNIMKFTFL